MIQKPKTPSERLLKATITGSLKGVKAAIEAGAAINTLDNDWGTALFIACQFNHPRIARYILSCPGVNITKGCTSSWPQGVGGCVMPYARQYNTTPLYAALEAGNLAIARMLLTHPDKRKYLQANRNWVNTIRCTFNNYMFNQRGLALLLDAASEDSELLQFSITTAIKEGFSWRHAEEELTELFQSRSRKEQKLILNAFAEYIGSLVRRNESQILKKTLASVASIGDMHALLPQLKEHLQTAQEKSRRECMLLLMEIIAQHDSDFMNEKRHSTMLSKENARTSSSC